MTFLRKVDVRDIVVEHMHTFVDARRNPTKSDYWLFFAVPVIPVTVLTVYSVHLTDGTISVLATALSILAGLLFNLLVLLHTLQWPSRGEPHDENVKRLLQELHANVAYSILIALVSLLPLIVASYYGPEDLRRTIFGLVAVYLSIHFALTMGMVLKRMDTLLQERLPDVK